MNVSVPPISLHDKYTAEAGNVYLSGIQTLVRLALDRGRLDRAKGLNTGGFISGYRGSPIAGYDTELQRSRQYLDPLDIQFQPGVNEELGATAVWGSQKVRQHGMGSSFDGVYGIWYGKAPGVDRAGDVLHQASASGTDPNGGVVALAGDDHLAKSSILPAQSEFFFQHAEIPVLNPADIQEVLDFGLHGFEMSRYTGLWSALICLADTMDASGVVSVDPGRLSFKRPVAFDPRKNAELNRVLLLGNRLETERLLRDIRIPAALTYAKANRLDHLAYGAQKPRIGMVATGKAFRDLCQALQLMGITDQRAKEIGLAVYKVGMPYPLEPTAFSSFARGLDKILVVEHKRAFIEPQIKEIAYNWPSNQQPKVLGKKDHEGNPLLSDVLELSIDEMIRVIMSFLPKEYINDQMRSVADTMMRQQMWAQGNGELAARSPFFCSGCPHNSSTVVPEGSRSMPGIGCHAMTEINGRTTDGQIAMGGEGSLWVGQANFARDKHVFANMGDGTYFHSGILSIRQAVAARVPITFKILYNDAVAMTGGQELDGSLTVPQLLNQLHAEGVEKVVLVTEHPDDYAGRRDLAVTEPVHHRDDLMKVQNALKEFKGVSAIVFDQTCAAEKRRRRKRGLYPDPDLRVFINDRVCEGCGDCSVQSNCLSVEPMETVFGEKRRINQSSCNKDFSCVKGFCPSFVYVEGSTLRQAKPADFALEEHVRKLPDVTLPSLENTRNLLVAGIGGMGVTTISAIVAMAAHIDGLKASTLDMTGLAQKGGPVTSHVRFAAATDTIEGPRVPPAQLDVLIASDMLVASKAEQLSLYHKNRTHGFVNVNVTPTSEFVMKQQQSFDVNKMTRTLEQGTHDLRAHDLAGIAEKLLGDSIFTNMMLVGLAYQAGTLPISSQAIETAISLNGTAVEKNIRAFQAGRVLYSNPDAVFAALPRMEAVKVMTLDEKIAFFAKELMDYQNKRYADAYLKTVAKVRARDDEFGPGSMAMTHATAEMLYKLMAYKDEYEVARLYSAPEFRQKLEAQFAHPGELKILLAPPILPSKPDAKTGRPQKRAFGPWIFKAFELLVSFRRLRGTAFDPFGYAQERKEERALIKQYTEDLSLVSAKVGTANYGLMCELLNLPDSIRGYGPIKDESIVIAQSRRGELLGQLAEDPTTVTLKEAAE
ncbi:indolepyruvate ferredoxin oxidoreductase family protein [Pseudovibrio sp. Tun.PSC04-5.I4]|uniref:indolepyruvate ferredoxin oxidoreductase family protein n=1 Tax=Pseudovibrio sp. Tun.PSC04-5.I4 TaxID=1798213 RepID=UPI00088FE12F|nr:indolepyruvate ferredoxin oxidoreductase family protein [Pseudovibrio sp. Tun.PSC04-5.I4]SDR37540.1 indolepyruvate ferredoxin oxidoreductase [Pseudovibrio sp. Tun.PSC04-5.I4]